MSNILVGCESVPALWRGPNDEPTPVTTVRAGEEVACIAWEDGGIVACADDVPLSELECNFAHEQGFAYALRYYMGEHPKSGGYCYDAEMVQRHIFGETTDADRLALARACAEVFHHD